MRVSGIALIGVGPDIEVARPGAGFRVAGALEPGVLVAGVVDHQFGDDAQPALMRFPDEAPARRATFRNPDGCRDIR